MSQRFLHLCFAAVLCTLSTPLLAQTLEDRVALPSVELQEGNSQQAGIEGLLFKQTSSKGFDLDGMRGGAYARWKLSESFIGGAKVGREAFWRGKTSKDGFYSGGFAQYALNSHVVTHAELYYHDSLHDFMVGSAGVTIQKELRQWRFSFDRELVYDSYTSLLGSETAAGWIGAARKSTLNLSVKQSWKASEGELKVSYGYVHARGVEKNRVMGLDGIFSTRLGKSLWSFVSKTQYLSFQREDGGVAGYFSPKTFASQGLFLSGQKILSEKDFATLEIGPAYQYISDASVSKKSQIGGQANFSLSRQLDENFQIQLQGEYLRLADLYAQILGRVYLHRTF